MKLPKPVTIDFEAFGIEGRPKYPPMPVGVSIKYPGKAAEYYAWGHPTKNNCCWSDGAKALAQAYQHQDGLLFQNGKFDVDVAEEWFGLKVPAWDKIHDTMFLLFLDDPHQRELGLKPAAERLLDWPAEEQDAVGEWLIAHQPVFDVKISRSKSSPHYFGRYIAYAPGDLVGKYANGDTKRTAALFKLLYRDIVDRGMLAAYDRERRLMPILLEMERQGLPVNLKQLRADVRLYNSWRDKLNAWVIKRLKVDPMINLDSGAQLMEAMIAAGAADPDKIPRTKPSKTYPEGQYQTNKEALLVGVTDKVLLSVLKYRTQLNTCLNTFMQPWLKTAEQSGGLIFTTWNQVRAPKGRDTAGTRTGRLSSTPNFQNIPNEFEPTFAHQAKGKGLPRCPFSGLPPLPKVRSYIVPFKGEVLIDRDYSQQEPRILGHFDGGSLMERYLAEPWIDFHDYAKAELEKMGKYYKRKPVKNINLGLIYGMGVPLLAEKNNMPVDETKELKKAILLLYPGLKAMYQDMKVRAANHEPIHTWGGREYYCEPPRLVDGRIRQFDYKLVNVLIQGSAADCTKEAIIRFHAKVVELKKVGVWKLLLNVHDQLTASVPRRDLKQAMEVMRVTMESVEFDVPILSEGAISTTNWDELKDYDKKGVIL
jgi:DNA polymerase I-like protein with 3'-5' exonuclease and polymerase domains